MKAFSLRVNVVQYVLVLFFCGFQSTLWPNLVGGIQSPQLWLCWVIFLTLYRPFFEALLTAYLLGLTLIPYTSMPLKMVWPALLIVVSAVSFAKNKVFWPGMRYFVGATAVSVVVWHLASLVLSAILEKPSAPLLFLPRTLESLLTILAAPAVYYLMNWTEFLRPDDIGEPGHATEAET